MEKSDMGHMDHIEAVVAADIAALREKEATYRGSWKKRGGVGAFMMLARKWDRLEGMLGQQNYDILKMIEGQVSYEKNNHPDRISTDGTVLAEVRDLRRYLLLVEAEMVARGVVGLDPPAKGALDKGRLLSDETLSRMQSYDHRLDLWSTARLRAELQDLGRSPPSPVGDVLAGAIRAELARRGPVASGWREEYNRPGTPEDGGHHARQEPEPKPKPGTPGHPLFTMPTENR